MFSLFSTSLKFKFVVVFVVVGENSITICHGITMFPYLDLLACLSPTEVQALLDEIASDPDDKHVPASVR